MYFITCCTHRRQRLLANSTVHTSFVRFAQRAYNQHGISIGRYVIMPDHLHFFVTPGENTDLAPWIGTLKRVVGQAVNLHGSAKPIWQRGFFDHVMRTAESYGQKWQYVSENPIRAGLVRPAEKWPYAGEIVALCYD
jgi:putative transposase